MLCQYMEKSSFHVINACDRMQSGWTIPDRSGEKVIANSHQTSLVWGKYFGLTRLVQFGESILATRQSGEKVMTNTQQTGLVRGKYFGLTRLVWLEGDG